MFIYVITNSATGKIYIGQHKGNNLKQYLQKKFYDAKRGRSGKSRLYNSMQTHPRDVWSIEPLISDVQTKEELDRLERLLIALYDTRNREVGYNIRPGGEQGFIGTHPEEWKKQQSARLRAIGHRPTVEATAKSTTVRRRLLDQTGLWPGSPFKDMTGNQLNDVAIVRRLDNTCAGDAMWECQCVCGALFVTEGGSLRSGHTQSCGCKKAQQDRHNLKPNLRDMTGVGINGVRVIDRAPDKPVTKSGKIKMQVMWNCHCYCGTPFVTSGERLRSGKTKSCGCLRRKLAACKHLGKEAAIEAIHRWQHAIHS